MMISAHKKVDMKADISQNDMTTSCEFYFFLIGYIFYWILLWCYDIFECRVYILAQIVYIFLKTTVKKLAWDKKYCKAGLQFVRCLFELTNTFIRKL